MKPPNHQQTEIIILFIVGNPRKKRNRSESEFFIPFKKSRSVCSISACLYQPSSNKLLLNKGRFVCGLMKMNDHDIEDSRKWSYVLRSQRRWKYYQAKDNNDDGQPMLGSDSDWVLVNCT